MRWTRRTALATPWLATLATLASLSCMTASNSGKSAAMTQEQKVARGKYLVMTNACSDCHTPGTLYGSADTTRWLSGTDLGWVGPWGVVHAANLTPDPETGLGTWTEDQIVAALRTGSRPDGRPLAPIMPWQSFANFTDEDAHAIAVYLMSIPAVKHQVPPVIPPGARMTGPLVIFPPPSAWDAMNLPKPPGEPASTRK
ncbi:MAG TPA: cytochrome c [Candidatus Sulfotelmatobacter sp.]|nr:cytochrome c [Candidatus Sulfotelmatobacter sp.]